MFEHPPKTSGFDAMRGLMAAVVCFSHALLLRGGSEDTLDLVAAVAARVAVLTFFVISGYVIALSIQQNALRNRGFSLSDYAYSRAFRIIPPLLVCYLLMLLLWAVSVLLGTSEGPPIAVHATSLQPDFASVVVAFATIGARGGLQAGLNDPLWTLQFEIQLYVIAGLSVFALAARKFAVFALVALYLLASFRPWYDGHLTAQLVFDFAFAAGWFVQRNRVPHRRLVGAAALLASGIVFALQPLQAIAPALSSDALALLAQALYAIFFAAILTDVGRWRTWLRKSGDFSYTLYIIHFPLLLFIGYAWFDKAGVFPGLAFAIAFGVAVILFAAILGSAIERSSDQRRAFFRLLRRYNSAARTAVREPKAPH